jgi:two-component system, OmpR family, sensor histidine kinase AdeS
MSLANSAQLALDLASIDMADVLWPTLAAMAPDLEAAGVTVDADLRPAPMIDDVARLRQALGAVLNNVKRYAANSETARIETGTSAAGLSVVRAIAEAHCGKVTLTSRAGGGAAFEMFLPRTPPRVDTVSTKA